MDDFSPMIAWNLWLSHTPAGRSNSELWNASEMSPQLHSGNVFRLAWSWTTKPSRSAKHICSYAASYGRSESGHCSTSFSRIDLGRLRGISSDTFMFDNIQEDAWDLP